MTDIKQMPREAMLPAGAIIRALGGCRPLARAIHDETQGAHKITSSAISRWTRPAEMCGTNGRVPLKHWAVLLRVAEKVNKRDLIKRLLDQHAE